MEIVLAVVHITRNNTKLKSSLLVTGYLITLYHLLDYNMLFKSKV